jgi:phosphoribosylanthranilate isomerase
MSVQVKICATRSVEAAQVAVETGADFIGMIFIPNVKTHTINRVTAKAICNSVRGNIQLVGVFQNMPLAVVKDIIVDCQLDFAQFHGDETPEYLRNINIKKIKAFRFSGAIDIKKARQQLGMFSVDYYLLDRIKQSEGPMLNLETAAQLTEEFPLFFAGGLTSENVQNVIKTVGPFGVDVASGVETNGKQDLEEIRAFINKAKGVIL